MEVEVKVLALFLQGERASAHFGTILGKPEHVATLF
jgi:hypothetical protein